MGHCNRFLDFSLTDGRTDGNTDRKLEYLRFAIIVLLRKVSAVSLAVCGQQRYDLPLSVCPAPSRVLYGLIDGWRKLCLHAPSVSRTLLSDAQILGRLVGGKWTSNGVDLI